MVRRSLMVFLILLVCAAPALVADDKEIRAKRDRAKAAIESGTVSPERDIGPLIDMLRKSKTDDDQRRLVDVIVDLGRHDGSSPAAVKQYINAQMTPILLALAENKKNSTFLRGDSVTGLRNMGASRTALEQVTKMALADADGYVKSRGEILENYLNSHGAGAEADTLKPADAAKEQEALAFLRSQKLGASADQLRRSAMEAKPEEVKALIAAGVPAESPDEDSALVSAIGACSSAGESAELLETVDALIAAGADVKRLDGNKNTPLMTAAQYCGEKVITRLLAAGADMNAMNGTGITPLGMALIMSKFDAAEALIAKGARLTKEQVAMVSGMENPRAKELALKAGPKGGAATKKKPVAAKKK